MPIRSERMALYPGGSIKSPEWQAIRERIRQRAGNQCEECGVFNGVIGFRDEAGFFHPTPGLAAGYRTFTRRGSTAKTFRIVCTVAHTDGDETNNEDTNLRFWCQRCHNRHDAKGRALNAAETRRKKKAAGDLLGGS